LSFDALSPWNPFKYPHKPYIGRNKSPLTYIFATDIGIYSFKYARLGYNYDAMEDVMDVQGHKIADFDTK